MLFYNLKQFHIFLKILVIIIARNQYVYSLEIRMDKAVKKVKQIFSVLLKLRSGWYVLLGLLLPPFRRSPPPLIVACYNSGYIFPYICKENYFSLRHRGGAIVNLKRIFHPQISFVNAYLAPEAWTTLTADIWTWCNN